MTPEYATPQDVQSVSDGVIPAPKVAALLEFAYVKLRGKVPGLNDRVAAGTIDRDAVKVVLVEMVQAVLRNTKGLRSETTGPFARSYDVSAASGLLKVTDEHLELLGLEADGGAATMLLADFGLPRCAHPDMGWC